MNAITAIAPAAHPAAPERTLLRFMTCGSVDDGKSTLIGRLLHDTGAVAEDQLESLERDSKRFGTTGGNLDFALLVDGLSAEREQGITIDVAFRYFSTAARSFIVADTPGHEQYTRNMATGASNVDLAVILLDASKGILPQTRRHSFLVSMMRVRHVVLAINKMDLIDFAQDRFEAIVADYQAMAEHLGFRSIVPIPLCARDGDNLAQRSERMPWYDGPSLLAHLEQVTIADEAADAAFRLPVQWVNRPDSGFRGYAGTVESGRIAPGDRIRVSPSGQTGRVARIVTADGDLPSASAGQAVTLTLDEAIDISRGDVIGALADQPNGTRQIEARLLWMTDEAGRPGADYIVRIGTAEAVARLDRLHHAIDIHRFTPAAFPPGGERLESNQIGDAQLRLDRVLTALPYAQNRALGGFILIDRLSHETVALGTVTSIEPAGARETNERAASKPASLPIPPQTGPVPAGWTETLQRQAAGGLITFAAIKLLGGGWQLAVGAALLDRLAKTLIRGTR